MTRRLVVVAVLLFLAACSGDGSGSDASATAACTHFKNVAADAGSGILNDAEFRGKLKEIYDSASVSEDAQLRDAARGMLASVTEGSPAERFKWHADDFVAACKRLGVYGESG